MKLNNKGMSIIEIVVTFTIIMSLMSGLLIIVVNYRNKASVSLQRLELDTLKNNLTQDINNDILEYGLKEIKEETFTTDTNSPCYGIGLNRCIVLYFYDTNIAPKALGVSKVSYVTQIDSENKENTLSDRQSIENKFIYYDGIKYKLKETLPDDIPAKRSLYDVAKIKMVDDGLLNSSFTVLEDGTKVYIYTIDIEISHIDFSDDFGIHIVASTDHIGM